MAFMQMQYADALTHRALVWIQRGRQPAGLCSWCLLSTSHLMGVQEEESPCDVERDAVSERIPQKIPPRVCVDGAAQVAPCGSGTEVATAMLLLLLHLSKTNVHQTNESGDQLAEDWR